MIIAQTRSSLLRLMMFSLVIWTATSSLAQVYPGRVTGRVQDAQGAVVSGANVKLTNPSTGLERTVTTDENGEFNFPELALGTFQLTVTKEGFETTIVTDIRTSLGRVNTVNPVMKVGTVTTEIEVSSLPPLIQTETNSAGGQLSQEQVTALPIGNSDYTRLALTLPGAVQNSNFAFAQYTINGSRSRSNAFNIDGASNTDPSTYLPLDQRRRQLGNRGYPLAARRDPGSQRHQQRCRRGYGAKCWQRDERCRTERNQQLPRNALRNPS